MKTKKIESHPLAPFVPSQATVLMLGSFPPPRNRWSMDFFYPNFQNDMWRVMGLLFYGKRDFFVLAGEKRFDSERVERFCREQGIALFDVGSRVCRLKENASDAFLQIVEVTDWEALMRRMPDCRTIVATGQKASEVIALRYGVDPPKVGESVEITLLGRSVRFFRMPSTSRAYPLPLEKKAEAYSRVFEGRGEKNQNIFL